MDSATLKSAQRLLQDAQKIIVISHIRPDGDAIGSVLGLGLALQSTGKDVQMVLEDGVPKSFRHLIGSDQILKRPTDLDACTIVVDCCELVIVRSVNSFKKFTAQY